MNKFLIWRGNDIGGGQIGGILHVKGRRFNVGDQVPVDILPAESLEVFIKKGALTPLGDTEVEDGEFQEVIGFESPATLTGDALKAYDDAVVVYTSAEQEIIELNKQLVTATDSFVELSESLNKAQTNVEVLKSENDADLSVFRDLVAAHSDNFQNSENALKEITKKLNNANESLEKEKADLLKLVNSNPDEEKRTEKQNQKISKTANKVESLSAEVLEIEKQKVDETQKFEAFSALLDSSKQELEELENNNDELDELEKISSDSKKALVLCDEQIVSLNEIIESKNSELLELKTKIDLIIASVDV